MKLKIILALVVSIIICILGVAIGSAMIPFYEILAVITNKVLGASGAVNIDKITASIIWDIRIPRVLMAFGVGAALAVSGAIMQSTLKNPLASSYTLGVSSGAALGAGIVMITGITIPMLGLFTLPTVGLICGLLTVLGAMGFAAGVDRNMETNTIILTGMVFTLFVNAMLTIISSLNREDAQRLIMWQFGSFSQKDWRYVILFLPVAIVLIIVTMFFVRELDILTFGEEHAKAAGVETTKVKWILLVLVSALTGCAVSFTGIIGFIDLVAPHIVRKLFGSSHRVVIPLSALFGGTFMVCADLIARTIISPSELPVGAVTALIGAPFFAYIYFSGRKRR
ncbi:FecCD family ABC transporter permease [Acetivibrio cellulolyticus]|uniref:FecCD family ABC transporter permease n=1 Tax=Acetivibrio cellulolyticus TaxID=35830 RepID=UPI000474DFC5|nr:iron ABC transporter permease [Acetivibrio cellulolyticus]